MYSFHNRGDVECFDEPFYAHYLTNRTHTAPGRDRPYHDLVVNEGMSAVDTWSHLLRPKREQTKIRFVKHMAKHAVVECHDPYKLYALNGDPLKYSKGWGGRPRCCTSMVTHLTETRNFILVRHPEDLVRSFNAVIPPTLEETCLPAQVEIFMLHAQFRKHRATMPVVLSEDLREKPRGYVEGAVQSHRDRVQARDAQVGSGPETRNRRMLGALVVQNHPREHAIRAAPPG